MEQEGKKTNIPISNLNLHDSAGKRNKEFQRCNLAACAYLPTGMGRLQNPSYALPMSNKVDFAMESAMSGPILANKLVENAPIFCNLQARLRS